MIPIKVATRFEPLHLRGQVAGTRAAAVDGDTRPVLSHTPSDVTHLPEKLFLTAAANAVAADRVHQLRDVLAAAPTSYRSLDGYRLLARPPEIIGTVPRRIAPTTPPSVPPNRWLAWLGEELVDTDPQRHVLLDRLRATGVRGQCHVVWSEDWR